MAHKSRRPDLRPFAADIIHAMPAAGFSVRLRAADENHAFFLACRYLWDTYGPDTLYMVGSVRPVEEPREYETAAEALRGAQERADREGRAAFVWYGRRCRWAVRDTEPTEADRGWTLATWKRPGEPVPTFNGAEG